MGAEITTEKLVEGKSKTEMDKLLRDNEVALGTGHGQKRDRLSEGQFVLEKKKDYLALINAKDSEFKKWLEENKEVGPEGLKKIIAALGDGSAKYQKSEGTNTLDDLEDIVGLYQDFKKSKGQDLGERNIHGIRTEKALEADLAAALGEKPVPAASDNKPRVEGHRSAAAQPPRPTPVTTPLTESAKIVALVEKETGGNAAQLNAIKNLAPMLAKVSSDDLHELMVSLSDPENRKLIEGSWDATIQTILGSMTVREGIVKHKLPSDIAAKVQSGMIAESELQIALRLAVRVAPKLVNKDPKLLAQAFSELATRQA